MENKAHALATGLFVLLLGAALVLAVLWFRNDRGDVQTFTVVARQGVPGLNVKAPVKLRGVVIGKVEDIGFDPAEPRQILVQIEVDSDAPLTPGTVAKLGYQGITGLSFIDLNDAEEGETPKANVLQTRRIDLQPSVLDQIANAGPRLVARAEETTRRLNRLLSDENQQQLTQTLGHLSEASAGLSQLVKQLQPTAQALPSLVKNADGLMVAGRRSLGQMDQLAGQGGELVQDLRTRAVALDRLGAAAAQLESTSRRLELALVGPDRVRQQPLVDELGQAARALERAAQSIADQPQSLILGPRPAPPGPGESGFEGRGK